MTSQSVIDKLIELTLQKKYKEIKELLTHPGVTGKFKGDIFELYLQELYEGNGWICRLNGGKADNGADLLLSHPDSPSVIQHIIQVKNHSKPLNFKDTRSELIQFEKVSSKEYNCTDYKLISINGYVEDATDREKMDELKKFSISLLDFSYIIGLINSYKPLDKRYNMKPTLSLYSHNELSYSRIMERWQTSNRTCIVLATGLGKSKVILKVLGDHFCNKNKLIIAPSNYILEQFKNDSDNWTISKKTTYLTYQGLLVLTDAEIKKLKPDVIVLDEFHRAGAKRWEEGVKKLLELYPNVKVLGTTATPIRSDGRDMSQELFGGNVANAISVQEAILTNKLPMPKYISAVYDLTEEVEKLKEKINTSSNPKEEKREILKMLENINIDWKNTKGLSDIIKRHIPSKECKGIVFCEDTKHLNKMSTVVEEWFVDASLDVKKYKVISSDPQHDEEFRAFKESKNKKINLLFAVNLLNEGVHIKEIDFLIFLRKTSSEIIYLQQLGRVLQADKNKTPIVFDFVSNFMNTKSSFISDFDKAIDVVYGSRKQLGLEDSETIRVKKQIQASVFTESKSVEELFKGMENLLVGDWYTRYEELKKYYNENDYSDVSRRFKENISLSLWVDAQRKAYKNGTLSVDKIKLLKEIGFSFTEFTNEDKYKMTRSKVYGAMVEFLNIKKAIVNLIKGVKDWSNKLMD